MIQQLTSEALLFGIAFFTTGGTRSAAAAASTAKAAATWTAARTTITTVIITIALLEHGRGAFFQRFDADGERADHVFADRFETLDFRDGGVRSINIEKA